MAKRKTLSVAEIVNQLNKNLLNSDFGVDLDRTEGRAFRQGICAAIEQVLFSSGQYQGFKYIDKKDAVKPYAWGCDYSKLTDTVEEQVVAFEGSDDTRRHYFIGRIK